MPRFIETCPLGITDKKISFTIDGDREPSPTKGCICGGTKEEQTLSLATTIADTTNFVNAWWESYNSNGKPVEYQSFEVKGEHGSIITKVD